MVQDATSGAPALQTASPAEVVERRGRGHAVELIDVRTPVEYAEVHAEGVRLVPLDRLDPAALVATRSGSADEPLFVICKSGGRAARAVERFRSAGFTNVVSVAGGTDAWQRAGLPVVRGPKAVVSLERQVRVAAGLLVLLGVVLGWLVHPVLSALAALAGAGLVLAGIADWCGMGMLLARMPWNRRAHEGSSGPDEAANCRR